MKICEHARKCESKICLHKNPHNTNVSCKLQRCGYGMLRCIKIEMEITDDNKRNNI